nr:MAG TPA: hypothetical protein [Caudoviricetes sp.]
MGDRPGYVEVIYRPPPGAPASRPALPGAVTS